MSVFGLFSRKKTANVARERLQILLAHERTGGGSSDLLAKLREEVLAAIAKHVDVDPSKVNVSMKKEDDVSIIEIDVEVPDEELPRLRVAAGR
jgi:cell division topological specificity factor